ncbi:hypothetical protein P261_01633 [Lachnospiraceae bacterium TWA4]|nr:hypothetical protein P261_01633 [Lachnospiraceae bacterium TWA4]
MLNKKKFGILLFFILSFILLFGFGTRADAASRIQNLKVNKTYKTKLTGTKTYKVQYKEVTHKGTDYNKDFRLYIDGKLKKEIKSQWAYGYKVQLLTVNSKRILIAVSDMEDNDYVDFNYIYEYKNNKLVLLKNLCDLTRSKNVEKATKLLNPGARGQIHSFDGKKLTLRWSDTTTATGLIEYMISYKISGNKITKSSTANAVRSATTGKTNPKWTSKYTLKAYTTAGGKKVAFTIKKGDKVTLKQMTIKGGKRYLQLTNSKRKTGWILNPTYDSKRTDGYFKESFFAG